MLSIVRFSPRYFRSLKIVLGFQAVLLVLALLLAGYSLTQHRASAVAVPESCFTMDDVDLGKIVSYNEGLDPDCVENPTIPDMINGNTVTTIGSGIFHDDTITAITLPGTIELIESGALTQAGVTLDGLTIAVSGDLVLKNGSISVASGDISIQVSGSLQDEGGITDSTVDSITIWTGDGFTGFNNSAPSTVGTVSITSQSPTIPMTIAASYLSSWTIDSLIIDSSSSLVIESGAFSNTPITSVELVSYDDMTLNGVFYSTTSLPVADSGTFSAIAGGSMSILSGTFNNYEDLVSLSLESNGGVLSIEDGSLCYSTSLTSLSLGAPEGLSILDGSVCNLSALDEIQFPNLSGDVYIFGFNNMALSSFELSTSGDLTITHGSFSNPSNLSSFKIEADGNLTVTNGSVAYNNTLTSIELWSGGDMIIEYGSFYDTTALVDVKIEANNVLMGSGIFTSNGSIESINILGNNDVIFSGGGILNQLTALVELTIEAGNDIDMTAGGGFIYQLSALESLSMIAGNDMLLGNANVATLDSLETLDLQIGNNFSAAGGSFHSLPKLAELNIYAPGDITLDEVSYYSNVETVILTAGGTIDITNSFYAMPELTTVTLNADSSVQISGNTSFYGTNIQAAYINAPSADINGEAFAMTGARWNNDDWTWEDFDQVRYTRLFIANPGSLTNTAHADQDVGNDGTTDRIGGYLINPAQIIISSQDGANNPLSMDTVILGRYADNSPVLNYLLTSNPSGDLDIYYQFGDTITITPTPVPGYQTPASKTIGIVAGANTVEFTYLPMEIPEVPNTGVRSPQSSATFNFVAAVFTGLAVLSAILVLLVRSYQRSR